MSADTEMERKICDFLKLNGKSKALIIAKEIETDKSTANKHLYNLERSNQVFKTDGQPPVWDLMEKKNEIKQTLKPEQKSPTTRDTSEEKEVEDLLRSGGLKAHQIARDLGQSRQTINKQLYSMEKKGTVKKCSNSAVWSLTEERSHDSFSQESESSEGQDCSLASRSLLSELFEIMGRIGKGAFGSIYKVKHKYDGKIYAVKQVSLIGEANSEVQGLARLNHPNIVRYITCWPSDDCASNQDRNTPGSSDGVIFERDGYEVRDEDDNDTGIANLSGTGMYLFIQMEFCKGGTLTDWIKAGKDLKKQRTTMEINKIFYEIISGVEFIHANELIHRDLKPDNILFGADGKVKIGDFGLVAAQTDQNGDPIKRSNVGTESYWSPEQETEENYEEKTDIFPLGLIWFEMLWKIDTGSERAELWPDLRNQRFPAGFSDKYPTEEQIIKKMLSNTPEDRPHAKDINKKLDRLFSLEQDLKVLFLP